MNSKRDHEADNRSLRRYKFAAPLADSREASLGDLLDCMLYSEGVDDREPFERRALGMLSALLDAISYCDEVPDGMLYALHRQTLVMIEIGRRLEKAGPPIETIETSEPDEPDNSPHSGENSETAQESAGAE